MLKVYVGLLKLQTEHPSTAFFGNGDVFKTVRRVADRLGLSVTPRAFCGKGCKGANNVELKVRDAENPAATESQWRQVVAEFARPDTALLMHLTNHYCMIYGVREWVEKAEDGSPRLVRQLLSSKPGQRPSKWMEWDDLRKMMLGWVGYKMMALKMAA